MSPLRGGKPQNRLLRNRNDGVAYALRACLVLPVIIKLAASVCLPVGILTVIHQGAACDAASVHFSPTIRRTDMLPEINSDCVEVSSFL